LQETNLVLWQRAAEFAPGSNFGGWARKVAYYQVLARYRDQGRERMTFDTELVAVLAREQEDQQSQYEERQRALQHCLSRLSEPSRDLIRRRYAPGGSVQAIAQKLGRSVGAISQALYRIRQSLVDCLNHSLEQPFAEQSP
jgi:RNA polymerase sigma-70 factor (ECF subfamily)